MTTLNLTITAERAWMSQDHALASTSKELPESVEKLHLCHNRKMVVGAAGSFLHAMLWRARLAAMPEGDISEVAQWAPDALREIVKIPVATDVADLIAIHAGWSSSEGRVIAFIYQRANDFVPHRVEQGHTYTPSELSNDAPGYPHLYELWPQAAEGRRVKEFHAALLENQRFSSAAGRLLNDTQISESFSIVAIDHLGIHREDIA